MGEILYPEGALNFGVRQSALAGNGPGVAFDSDNCRAKRSASVTCIEDQRQAFAKLFDQLRNIRAGRAAGKIRACAGHRAAERFDQRSNDPRVGPADRHTTGVAGDFERKPVSRLDNKGQGARPEFVRKSQEGVRNIAGEHERLLDRVDEDRKGACFGAGL